MMLISSGDGDAHSSEKQEHQQQRHHNQIPAGEGTIPDTFSSLNELAGSVPLKDSHEENLDPNGSLEEQRGEISQQNHAIDSNQQPNETRFSSTATKLYTLSYLIFFSFLGTLARLGLQDITFYPGAPAAFSVLWANFGGCIIMGFLAEDRKLFKNEWGHPTYHEALVKARADDEDLNTAEVHAAKKTHSAVKKTIPLFVGLSTGFCGCFTSFSSFVRDVFLALSNTMSVPDNTDYLHAPSRNGGYSFMAVLAVIILTVTVCISGLILGAHLAIALEPFTFSISVNFNRKWIDPAFVILAFGSWLGAVLLAIFPPSTLWRGRALFSLVFAPIGCLARYYLSIYLNSKIPSFPLGTFTANILGTAILGMCWDLQHVPLGGEIGCQVLQGVQDGFCGCLTTVSTWVVELSSLRRGHAYRYGTASVVAGLAVLVVIMGTMHWTIGFEALLCSH